jgi:hypothetical protein
VLLAAIIGLLVVKLIKGVNDAAATVGLQVQVNHCSLNLTMSQEFFNAVQIGTGIKQMSSEGMAKGMYAILFMLKTCLPHRLFYSMLYAAAMHRLAFGIAFKQVGLRTVPANVLS